MIVKIGFGRVFLILVLSLYLLTFIFSRSLFFESVLRSKNVLGDIILVLILVFVLTFFANLWFTNKKTDKILKGRANFVGYISAVFLGILSTGPIYMWYPLLSELKEEGLDTSLIAIFLYNRAVKIPLMPMIMFYFGLPFLLVSTFFMIIFSILNGYFVAKFT